MIFDVLDIRAPLRHVVKPIAVLAGIFSIGTVGYWMLGGGIWSWMDCAYMTAITMSTVGFHEAVPIGDDPLLRGYTIGLILVGAGSVVYLLSNITAFFVEGELNEAIRRRRMERKTERMRNHFVVCGVGRNGEYAAQQMAEGGHDVVVVDRSEEAIQSFLELVGHQLPYVVGDATDEAVLHREGLPHARGLIAALAEDSDNIFLVLGARELNPGIRIVAKANEPRSQRKFSQIGVSNTVNPAAMGGHRMYQEMVRPQVTNFVDGLLLATGEDLVIEEVPVQSDSWLAGKRLADSEIRTRTNVLIVGVRDAESAAFAYNPGPEFQLHVGATLIAIGTREAVQSLDEMGRVSG